MSRPGSTIAVVAGTALTDELVPRLRRLLPGSVITAVGYDDGAQLRIGKSEGWPAERIRDAQPKLSEPDRRALAEADIAIARDLPLETVRLAPRLRWVQATGAGTGQLGRVLHGSDVILTSASGVAAPSVAEFAMARILQVVRHLHDIDAAQQERTWTAAPSPTLARRSMLIVGAGSVARELSRRARAFSMTVTAVSRLPRADDRADFDRIVSADRLADELPHADVVVLGVASTAQTRHLIGAPQLAAMRDTAVLCNVARGTLVDERALIAALDGGSISAAVLDVTQQEPLPPGDPLWRAPRCFISAHTATSMDGYHDLLADLFVDNHERWASGRGLRNIVHDDRGY